MNRLRRPGLRFAIVLVLSELVAIGVAGAATVGSEVLRELVPSIEARMPQWTSAWKKATPDFDLRSFQPLERKAISEEWRPYDFSSPYEELRKKLYIVSPDATQAIDLDARLQFRVVDGRVHVAFEEDDTLVLKDLRGHRAKWLAMCRPSCAFQDAAWLTVAVAVVGSYGSDFTDPNCPNSDACKSIPYLSVYDFSKHFVRTYRGPGVVGGPRNAYNVQRIREKLPDVNF